MLLLFLSHELNTIDTADPIQVQARSQADFGHPQDSTREVSVHCSRKPTAWWGDGHIGEVLFIWCRIHHWSLVIYFCRAYVTLCFRLLAKLRCQQSFLAQIPSLLSFIHKQDVANHTEDPRARHSKSRMKV